MSNTQIMIMVLILYFVNCGLTLCTLLSCERKIVEEKLSRLKQIDLLIDLIKSLDISIQEVEDWKENQ